MARAAYLLPRDLHPAAWWVWALGLAVAASRTTNPWLLATIVAVAGYVVVARRSDAPWALSFRLYLWLGALIVITRVVFRIIFGGAEGSTILVTLPEIPLPEAAAGIRLLGAVSAESVLAGLYDGLRLATMVVCLGAANALANPKRLLRSMPSALYEVGAAVVVALSFFPQLSESLVRVRRARRLRGDVGKGVRAPRSLVIPVLEDALDRSLQLAASMDSRGYGRTGGLDRRTRATTGTLLVAGLVGMCVGVYATLDTLTPRYLAAPMLVVGLVLAGTGFVIAGRRVQRTRYRPDHWHAAEVAVAACGLAVASVLVAVGEGASAATLVPAVVSATWPPLTWAPLLGVLIGTLPAWVSPPPRPTHVSADADRMPAGAIA